MTAPILRIVIGTAGSGKSTIAQRLAREHDAAYLDKDAMSARFVEAALAAAGYDPGDRESNAFYLRAHPAPGVRLAPRCRRDQPAHRPPGRDRRAVQPVSGRSALHQPPRRNASTGRPSTSRWSSSASPQRRFDSAYGNEASNGTASSSTTGTSTGPSTEGDPAPGQGSVRQKSSTTNRSGLIVAGTAKPSHPRRPGRSLGENPIASPTEEKR